MGFIGGLFNRLLVPSSVSVPTVKNVSINSDLTGSVYTLTRLLGTTSTISLMTGTHANLTKSGLNILAAAGLGNNNTQQALVREENGQVAVEYPVIFTAINVAVATPATSFFLNGANNNKLYAALNRVKLGQSRAKIVWKGDNVTVGQGGGTTADSYGLTNARINRPAAVVAAALSLAGVPATDGAVVGDNGMSINNISLATYDPRISITSPNWTVTSSPNLAGGGYLNSKTGTFSFNPGFALNTFDFSYYNSSNENYTAKIDGSSPLFGENFSSSSGTGHSRQLIGASDVANHVLSVTANQSVGAVMSIRGYNSAITGVDMVVHASLGARSADQAASNDDGLGWSSLEALAFESPDFTIINLGLNDGANGVSVSAYTTNLQAIITKAKITGDVLLISPHPVSPSFSPTAKQIALRDAASALAESNAVSYLDLYTYFGSFAAISSRLFDGLAHPKAEMYAEIGAQITNAIKLMVADRGIFTTTAPAPTPAPAFTTPPTMSGALKVGSLLTGNDGVITNGTVSARQWLFNGSPIADAAGTTYTPTQIGSYTYRVTATGAGGTTTATSVVTGVTAATPAPAGTISAPIITKTSASGVNPMTISISLPDDMDHTVNKIRAQRSNSADFSTNLVTELIQLDENIIEGPELPLNLLTDPMPSGDNNIWIREESPDGTIVSPWSNIVYDNLAVKPDFVYNSFLLLNNNTRTGTMNFVAGRNLIVIREYGHQLSAATIGGVAATFHGRMDTGSAGGYAGWSYWTVTLPTGGDKPFTFTGSGTLSSADMRIFTGALKGVGAFVRIAAENEHYLNAYKLYPATFAIDNYPADTAFTDIPIGGLAVHGFLNTSSDVISPYNIRFDRVVDNTFVVGSSPRNQLPQGFSLVTVKNFYGGMAYAVFGPAV